MEEEASGTKTDRKSKFTSLTDENAVQHILQNENLGEEPTTTTAACTRRPTRAVAARKAAPSAAALAAKTLRPAAALAAALRPAMAAGTAPAKTAE